MRLDGLGGPVGLRGPDCFLSQQCRERLQGMQPLKPLNPLCIGGASLLLPSPQLLLAELGMPSHACACTHQASIGPHLAHLTALHTTSLPCRPGPEELSPQKGLQGPSLQARA